MAETSTTVDDNKRAVPGLVAQLVHPSGGGLLRPAQGARSPYLYVATAPPDAAVPPFDARSVRAGAFRLPAPGQLALYGPAPPGEPRPLLEITAQSAPRLVRDGGAVRRVWPAAVVTVRWGAVGGSPAPPAGAPAVFRRCVRCGVTVPLSSALQSGGRSIACLPAALGPYRCAYVGQAPWLAPFAAEIETEYPCCSECAPGPHRTVSLA